MTNLFASLLKGAGNEYGADIVDNGVAAGDVTYYVPTGSFTLNALLSGSIYGGLPGNKVYALAGEPSTGKTFYALNICKRFQKDNPEGFVFYFESESALSKTMLEDRGIDTKRMAVMPVTTIQEFRTQAVRILDEYLETPEKDRPKMMMVLDSLGNLSSQKEVEDIAAGKDTRDMTKSQLIKGAFRVITLKLGLARVPMIVTNHIYDIIGSYVPMKKMSGGSGLEYAASGIVFLSKKKDKDKDNNVMGNIITAVLKKSRLTIEAKKVETLLDFREGLDPYYGLVALAVKFGVFTQLPKQIGLPDGTKVNESAIEKNPEKYFTKDILDKIDDACKNEFLYGKTNLVESENENS